MLWFAYFITSKIFKILLWPQIQIQTPPETPGLNIQKLARYLFGRRAGQKAFAKVCILFRNKGLWPLIAIVNGGTNYESRYWGKWPMVLKPIFTQQFKSQLKKVKNVYTAI